MMAAMALVKYGPVDCQCIDLLGEASQRGIQRRGILQIERHLGQATSGIAWSKDKLEATMWRKQASRDVCSWHVGTAPAVSRWPLHVFLYFRPRSIEFEMSRANSLATHSGPWPSDFHWTTVTNWAHSIMTRALSAH